MQEVITTFGAIEWDAVVAELLIGIIIALLNRYFALLGGWDDRAGTSAPPRSWLARATFPKSWVHLVETFALTLIGIVWGIHVVLAAALAFLIMLGYEWSQRHFDARDIAANAVGAACGILAVVLGAVFR